VLGALPLLEQMVYQAVVSMAVIWVSRMVERLTDWSLNSWAVLKDD
jgi:hypothetical protein